MQTFEHKIDIKLTYNFAPDYTPQEIVFFDIETTGFGADVTALYLIGCCYYEDSSWRIVQWFANDYNSEILMIQTFFDFIHNYKVLIHYNGTGFDIPYLSKKCAFHDLNYDFTKIISLDIYKQLLPYKKILNLSSLKQKSLEQFFCIQRDDKYNGKELIEVYVNYMKCKFMRDSKEGELLSTLLLHNTEDLKGLLLILPALSYSDLFKQSATIQTVVLETNHLFVTLETKNPFPAPVSWIKENISFSVCDNRVFIQIPIFQGELKYFFDKYKDYYYLPLEDTAIHKSVATYVDKQYRVKASASNCYSRKKGLFIPQFSHSITPNFKQNYSDKISYIEASEDFLKNNHSLDIYISNLFKYMNRKE